MRPVAFILVLGTVACGAPEPQAASQGTARTEAGGVDPMRGMRGMDMAGDVPIDGSAPIRITPRQAALTGITFTVARAAPVERTVRAVAMVVPNERGLGIVNARVTGWVERLYINETGQRVELGEPLFELYAPDLVTAQEELLLARRLRGTPGGDSVLAATRRRLALWEIPEEEIAAVEQSGVARRTLSIRSPFQGHVLQKHVIAGQMIRAGDRLFELADLSTVWIEPAIFESDIPLIRVGQRATMRFDALPALAFEGRVTFMHPTLDMRTRTLRVRVEISNPRLEIRPMMYGTVQIQTRGPRAVVVPLTAVLPTGDRNLAFVVRGGGVIPTEVRVGTRGDSTVSIVDGLAVGDTVVASATFLVDSESSLAAAMAGIMLNMGMGLDMGGMSMSEMDDMDRSGMRNVPGTGAGDSMPGMQMDAARRKEQRP